MSEDGLCTVSDLAAQALLIVVKSISQLLLALGIEATGTRIRSHHLLTVAALRGIF